MTKIKKWMSQLPLGSKQALIISITSVICILFACTTFFVNDYIFSRKNFNREIDVIMDLIRINSVAPLYFDDPVAAEEVLFSLKASYESVAGAALYKTDGSLFATYVRDNEKTIRAELPEFPELDKQMPGNIRRSRIEPVVFKGETIGYLYFLADFTRYKKVLLWYASLTLIILVMAVCIALFLSSYLKKFIIAPIYHLFGVARQISREKDFSIRAQPFYEDEIGQLILGFNEMIEKIQRRDFELARHRKTLEKRVEERTSDLIQANSMLTRLNQDLMWAKQRAEKANSAKSDFLASMSHELRTPLNGILGCAQLFQKFDANLNQEEKERIRVIHECGDHLLEMITDILDLSKVEAGKMELQERKFFLADFLQTTVAITWSKAEEKGLEVSCSFPSKGPKFFIGDDQRLRQVLLNLLSNAVKFTDKGTVSFVAEHLENGKIRFSVEDTGVGIPESLLGEIFKSFTQIGDIRHKSEGTGLGLAISQRLVRLMGGELKVESCVGRGSRFWFDLNLSPIRGHAGENTEDLLLNSVSGYHRPDGNPDPVKVLVVDDIKDNRSLLIDALTHMGFETAEASNGEEAIEACLNKSFDLILMDIVMPVMDGLEASKKILALDWEVPPVIIAVSASKTLEMEDKVLEAGCLSLIVKPIRFGPLFETIEERLDLVLENRRESVDLQTVSADLLPIQERMKVMQMASDGDISAILDWCAAASGRGGKIDPILKRIETLTRQFKINEIKCLVATKNGE